MKKILLLLLFTPLFFSTTEAQIGAVTPHRFDVLNYELHLDLYDNFLPPYPSLYYATEIITLEVDSTLSALVFDAKKSKLIVDSVAFPAISFVQDADYVTITLNTTYNPDDTLVIPIYYHHKDVVDPSFYAYNGYIYTDCEPEGAHNWFVCYDKPTDKATVEIYVSGPENAEIAANGSLLNTTVTDGIKTFHWKSRDPMSTYLVALVGKTNYNLDINYWHPLTHPEDSIPLTYYYANSEDIGTTETTMPLMLDYFSELYGDYPFEKYANASSIEFYSEGMENQSVTIICKNCWSEWLLSHELAHQWFGDLISPKSWADIFMNEGFASYNELLWGTHLTGIDALEDSITEYANYYFDENPGFPISMESWATHTPPFDTLFNDVITYVKAPCVIHMLRNVVGDSTFFATLKAYTTDTFNFMYKNVSIDDFAAYFSENSGITLDYFFDEWLKQPNHPVYANTYYVYPEVDASTVNYTINQTQLDPPFFTMPVELLFNFSDGSDTLITIFNNVNNQNFNFHFSKIVTAVTFDPENKIVLKEFSYTSPINTPDIPLNVSIFPNPSDNNFNISFTLDKPETVTLKLLNMQGEMVYTNRQGIINTGHHTISLQTEGLNAGTYLLLITTESAANSYIIIKN